MTTTETVGIASNPAALARQALELEAAGDLASAAACWDRAIALQPRRADFHHTRGDVLRAMRKLAEAAASYERAIECDPGLAASWCNLCAAMRSLGRPREAVAAGRKAVELNPSLAPAHNNLALALTDIGESREALAAVQRLFALDPNSAVSHRTAARALISVGEQAMALQHLEIARQLDPSSADIWIELGDLLCDLNRLDDAMAAFKAAQSRNAFLVEAKTGRIKVHAMRGEHAQALDLAEEILQTAPENAPAVLATAEQYRRAKRHSDAAALLRRTLDSGTADVSSRRVMLFQLGDALDRLGECDAAWRAYQEANALKPVRHDRSLFESQTANIRRAFTAPMSVASPSEEPSPRLIFIAGMPRSGTTLIEQILSSHPMVHGCGEMGLLGRAIGRIPALLGDKTPYPKCVSGWTPREVRAVRDFCIGEFRKIDAARPVLTEKSTDNFLHVGLIRLLFPEAVVIDCRRDPLDACLSCYFHDFAGHHPYAYSLADLGHYWRQKETMMDHWRSTFGDSILTIEYEQVVADQETQTRRLLESCSLPWDDACLAFHESARLVQTASRDQVRQPMYATSVRRHRRYEAHLEELKRAIRSVGP